MSALMTPFIAALFTPLWTCAAFCTCLIAPLAEEYKDAHAVFLGRLDWIETTTGEGHLRADGAITTMVTERRLYFKVSRVWKGPRDSTLAVWTGAGIGDCGLEGIKVDQEWLVFAYRTPRGLGTGSCGRTGLATKSLARIDSLGPSRAVH
jgi:hypothetical protein